MVRIHCYNMSQEELVLAEAWAQHRHVQLTYTDQPLTVETLALAEGADGICLAQMEPFDTSLYARLFQMGIKQIAQRSAGVDMYDLLAAKENGITITNVPSYSPESIAEFTVLRILQLLRLENGIRQNVEKRDFTWDVAIRGQVLGEKTVAVIGVGRIGSRVARFLSAFGCPILGYDICPDPELADLVDYQDSLEEIVAQADIISLHLPLTQETEYLFDRGLLSRCKPGTLFLNMARGRLLDTRALLDSLNERPIAAAALDTFEGEGELVRQDLQGQDIADPLFEAILHHPHILYSPHVAYYTETAVREIVEQALDAALSIIETGQSENSVNA